MTRAPFERTCLTGARATSVAGAERVKERPAVGSGNGVDGVEGQFHNTRGTEKAMKRLFAAIMSVAVFAALAPVADAQSQCPAEVGQAQAMLQKVSKAQEVQAPRSLAGARQDIQGPRTTQDVQAPRSLAGARQHDVQAPRS